jgi:hypothetical protein
MAPPVPAAALIAHQMVRDDVAKKRHFVRDRFRPEKIKAAPDRSSACGSYCPAPRPFV